MKQLGKNLIERIYYVNSGVIYNIGPIVSNPDTHAVVITAEDDNKIEKLFVDSQKLYFDTLIEDGDKYTSGSFTKTVHELEPTVSSTTYYNYYLFLCEQEIRKGIIENANLTYQELVINVDKKGEFFSRLGVPEYMVEQTRALAGITVKTGKTGTGSQATVINLDENTFNTWKKEEATKRAVEATSKEADKYGFKITDTEGLETCIKSNMEAK